MSVQLDHTIIAVHDQDESARFVAEILGLAAPSRSGPFQVVTVDHGLSLDFANANGDVRPQHYAFLVSDAEFDTIFGRIVERALPYWADPRRTRPGEIREHEHGRGFYFEDPSGHFLEVLTRASTNDPS
jgi:catechol 2,3-dioxygenase-like lactoylglutathione lyase family enzyme